MTLIETHSHPIKIWTLCSVIHHEENSRWIDMWHKRNHSFQARSVLLSEALTNLSLPPTISQWQYEGAHRVPPLCVHSSVFQLSSFTGNVDTSGGENVTTPHHYHHHQYYSSFQRSCTTDRDCPRLLSQTTILGWGRCLCGSNGAAGCLNSRCAECLKDLDCNYDEYCSGFSCKKMIDSRMTGWWGALSARKASLYQ